MPFTNTFPKPIIYSKHLKFKTMRYYAWLISRKYFEQKCFSCGNLKKPLHVHHKNKNIWDNRILNLEILCPKCHFKTDFPNGRTAWFKGRHHTKKSKELLRKHRLGTKLTKAHKLAIGLGGKGRKFSDIHRKRIGLSIKKHYNNKLLRGD